MLGATAGRTRAVHVVVPDMIDDPSRPSGGNRYDRRVCDELATAGWQVTVHPVAGSWPYPDAEARRRLSRLVAGIPDLAAVLVDGLVASNAPDIFVPAAGRLHVVVVLHTSLIEMPSARDLMRDGAPPATDLAVARRHESAVLSAARGIVTTSTWTREQICARYSLPIDTITVAQPGADPAEPAAPSRNGARFLCVAAVAPHKGHDVLLEALARVSDLEWSCRLVGPLDAAGDYADAMRQRAMDLGVAARIDFRGPLHGDELDVAYRTTDLLLHPSRYETYGMVVTEALARGVPVVAARVGGLPEALGQATDGCRPGVLTPPGDPSALAAVLRAWLQNAALRARLRAAARERRSALLPWSETAARIAVVLDDGRPALEVPA